MDLFNITLITDAVDSVILGLLFRAVVLFFKKKYYLLLLSGF